jgi:hypothetical protein
MWITRLPVASMRAAAAMTSITMNGGTSLRAEGTISRFADSSIDSMVRYLALLAPLLPHSAVSLRAPPGETTARYQLAGSGAMGAVPHKDARGKLTCYR